MMRIVRKNLLCGSDLSSPLIAVITVSLALGYR